MMRRKMTEMTKIGRKMAGTSKNVIKEEDGTREDKSCSSTLLKCPGKLSVLRNLAFNSLTVYFM